MRKSAKLKRRGHCLDLLQSSHAAAAALARRGEIEVELKAANRRVWPVARVARLFEVSVALLRKWMASGCLMKRKALLPGEARGICVEALRDFLKNLAYAGKLGAHPPEGRESPKTDRCIRKVCFYTRKGVTPKALAARAAVSVSLVRLLIRAGKLKIHRPKPGRILIKDVVWAEI